MDKKYVLTLDLGTQSARASLIDEKGNIVELTAALKEKLFAELVKLELGTSANAYQNNIDRVMFELRQAAGLEIFAEGVEVAYKQSYDSVFSALDITDYEAFKATPNTSATEVVKWNGGSITVDQMFNALTTRYGALITLLFVQQYTILTSEHNTIVNYVTGEVLNSERYEELTEEERKDAKAKTQKVVYETAEIDFVNKYVDIFGKAGLKLKTIHNGVQLATEYFTKQAAGKTVLYMILDGKSLVTIFFAEGKYY